MFGLPRGNVLRRLEERVPHHREAAVRVVVRELVRPGSRNRPVLDRRVRVTGHRRREQESEDRQEVASRLGEPDGDRSLRVVRDDSRDVAAGRRVLRVGLGPGDVCVEAHALTLGEEASLDRPFEVGGLDGSSVRILHALAELELVDLAVPRNGRQGLSKARHELVAGRPVHVTVRQERLVDIPHRPPRLARVGLLGVEVVDRVDHCTQGSERLRILLGDLGAISRDTMCRNHQRDPSRERNDAHQWSPVSLPAHHTSRLRLPRILLRRGILAEVAKL